MVTTGKVGLLTSAILSELFCPLGVEDGTIADGQMTANSKHPGWNGLRWDATAARLNGRSGWVPASKSNYNKF